MGKVRVRKETGNLLLDFMYRGIRCREQTALTNTPLNRKKVTALMEKIDAEILLGTFNYRDYFPNSAIAARIERAANSVESSAAQRFDTFTDIWFKEMEVTWRESYRSGVQALLKNRLIPDFGRKSVDQITKQDILAFRARLSTINGIHGKPLSATHINRHIKLLGMILNEAAERYGFTSPYQNFKHLKVPKTDIDPFTLEEILQFLKSVDARYSNYYTVRFFTGMRTAEIDGLQWKYVDLDSKSILVRETLVQGRNEYTKNDASQREIQLAQPVIDSLQDQLNITGQYPYVFCNNKGNPLNHNNVTKRIWYPTLSRLSFRRRTPYQTRHTAATLWLAAGESPEWIARQMGHSSTEMLFTVYSRYVPNLTRQDGSAFGRFLSERLPDYQPPTSTGDQQ